MEDSFFMKLDFLKELGNIGIGHAATSLSDMVGNDVKISLPSITLTSVENVIGMQPDELVAATTGIGGDVKGILVNTFTKNTAFWLIDKMSQQAPGTTKEFDDMGKSAIKEFINILGGAFLSSLSDFLSHDLMPKVPNLLEGKGHEIKEQLKEIIYKEVKDVLYVKTDLHIGEERIESDLFLVLDQESFNKIFSMMASADEEKKSE